MKRRNGLTMIEVMIASSILIVVVLIIYAVFDSSDKTYRTQVPVKEAQFKCQKLLENVSREAHESGNDFIWGAAISGETHPTGLTTAMVWASARNVADQFVTDGSYQPVWQKTMALVPLNEPDGTVTLYRYSFQTTPPAMPACYPQVLISGSTLQIQWLRTSDGAVESTSIAVSRSSGIKELTEAMLFTVAPVPPMADPNGGPNITLDTIKIVCQVRATSPNGSVTVGAETSIRGRN